jgi:protochlorophyllide reductase
LECNLADLKSIQSCIDTITSQKIHIDVLCLNAAIARNTSAQDVVRTNQGFEATIGTNHIGHFYLSQGLLPFIQERIVVTASGVHDPASPGGAQGSQATLGTLKGMMEQGIDFEMVDGATFDADKAYKDSKVCVYIFYSIILK